MADDDRRAALDGADLSGDLMPGQRRKFNLGNMTMPEADDDQIAKAAEEIGRAHGANRQVAPGEGAATEPEVAPPEMAPPIAAIEMTSIHIQIPAYLDEALGIDALKSKSSRQHIIMRGLRALGYQIEDDHMVPDRRRARAKKGK
jgi:hypothetical protein